MRKCNSCKHYYITWDKKFPYGCKAMGFKSGEAPSLTVYKSSGAECLLFEPRDSKPKPQTTAKAMGFKSGEAPSLTVYKSSGAECILFEPRDSKPKPQTTAL